MNLKTLLNKTIAGAKYILAQPTMMFRNRDAVEIIAYHIVKDDEAVRPDLIALEHYRDDSKTDIILKWNGISDPFSLLPGEVLEIPSDMVPFYKLDRPVRVENNKIKNQFVQGKKMNKKDQNRLDALKKKYNKEVLLPPNVIAIGKKNYRFTAGGTVILGAQAQNDAVTDSIISDLANGQGLRDDVIAQQSGNGSGSGTGSGSGGGTGLTETQLDKNLLNNAGRGGASAGSGAGAGSADPTGGAAGDGTAPQSTGGAANISNDGAPCN
tara:strand:+ start:6925 stop:7728 length:804 start_codon:yes stop_codon:yes gene_type:complete